MKSVQLFTGVVTIDFYRTGSVKGELMTMPRAWCLGKLAQCGERLLGSALPSVWVLALAVLHRCGSGCKDAVRFSSVISVGCPCIVFVFTEFLSLLRGVYVTTVSCLHSSCNLLASCLHVERKYNNFPLAYNLPRHPRKADIHGCAAFLCVVVPWCGVRNTSERQQNTSS